MEHGDPPGLGRTVEFEESGFREHFHDRALGVGACRGGGDQQLRDKLEAFGGAFRCRNVEQHGVVGRYQRGEGGPGPREGAQAQRRIEAPARKDRDRRVAIDKCSEEVERIGMAHRHDEQPVVAAVQAHFDLGHQGQHRHAAVAANRALGISRRARCVHDAPGVVGQDGGIGLAVRSRSQQALIVAPPGRPGSQADRDEAVLRQGDGVANAFGDRDQRIFDDQRRSAAVFDYVARFRAGQAEVDRHGDQPRFRSGRVDFRPFDAIVGEDRHPVALCEAEAGQRVGKPAGARIPLPVGHRTLEVARGQLLRLHPRLRA